MRIEEDLLHYVWSLIKSQRLKLKTVSGEDVVVKEPGTLNRFEGPDFKQSIVQIGNQTWAGCVEVHVKSSDWLRHNHQNDPNYDNVILHVVYEADQAVRYQNNELIPTLELGKYLTEKQFQIYRSLKYNELGMPCSRQIHHVEPVYLANMLHKAAIHRLDSKSKEIVKALNNQNQGWNEAFYFLLARNFGFKQNAEPMLALAKSIPMKILAKHKNSALEIESTLMGQAGFLKDALGDEFHREMMNTYDFLRKKYSLKPMQNENWKVMKVRPSNHPILRVSQLANLICNSSYLFSKVLDTRNTNELMALFRTRANPYWEHFTHFGQARKRKRTVTLGTESLYLILINTVAPTLYAYGNYHQETVWKQRAINLLLSLPKEQNRIIKRYQGYGFSIQSALDSQGTIAMERDFCKLRKCANCLIGRHLLNAG